MTHMHETEDSCPDGDLSPALLAQLEAALCLPPDMTDAEKATRMSAARALLAGIDATANGIGAMLACQMVAAHEAAMACLGRALMPGGPDTPPERIDRDLRHGARLMGLFTRQIEALDRHQIREADRQDRMEDDRKRAEQQDFLDQFAATGDMNLQSLLASLPGGDYAGEEEAGSTDATNDASPGNSVEYVVINRGPDGNGPDDEGPDIERMDSESTGDERTDDGGAGDTPDAPEAPDAPDAPDAPKQRPGQGQRKDTQQKEPRRTRRRYGPGSYIREGGI